jgi:hypothetical protein
MRERCPHCGNKLWAAQGVAPAPVPSGPAVTVTPRAKARVKALNKTEQRWLDTIAPVHFPAATVFAQAFTLPLEGGGTYRADFVCIYLSRYPTLIEVKGGFKGPGWEQGIERYRRARTQWEKVFGFELWDWDKETQRWKVEK